MIRFSPPDPRHDALDRQEGKLLNSLLTARLLSEKAYRDLLTIQRPRFMQIDRERQVLLSESKAK